MKIGRILHSGKEHYIAVKGGELILLQNVQRNNLGIENWFDIDPSDLKFGEKIVDLKDSNFEWLPPIARPGKILCIGRNYAKHAYEQGKLPEELPILFTKYSTSMKGHLSSIAYPSFTSNLDYEVELAIVIGKTTSNLNEKESSSPYIYGYTVANDLTAREVQKSEKQWTRGKGFDNSLPIGPLIVTKDEIQDPQKLDIWLSVNEEMRQQSSTSRMIFNIDYLVKYISKVITLEAGDIILTGTPEGVGFYMDPKATLKSGDHVSCGVSEVCELRFFIK